MNLLYANCYAFTPGESVGPHASQSVMRLVCLAGHGRLDVPDGGWDLHPGMVIGLRRAQPRWYRAADKDPFTLIGVHVGRGHRPAAHVDVPRWPVVRAPSPSAWLRHDQAGHVTICARRLAAVFAEPPSAGRTRHLAALLAVFDAECDRLTELPVHAAPLVELAAWLTAHLDQEVSRSDLAKRAGMAESTFAAAFTAIHGSPPGQFLIAARIRAAATLLADTVLPIPEIAKRCGFPDAPHFARTFRQWQGTTATQWRNTRRGGL